MSSQKATLEAMSRGSRVSHRGHCLSETSQNGPAP